MEVTYRVTPTDVLYFQRYVSRRSKQWMEQAFDSVVALLVGVLTVVLVIVSANKTSVIISFALPVGILLLWRAYIVRFVSGQAMKTPGMIFPCTLRITPDFVCATVPDTEIKTYWQGVLDVSQDDDYLFIALNQSFGIMLYKQYGYIVPKRAFVDPTHADEFCGALFACWNAARRGEAAPVIGESGAWPPAPRVGV